MKIVFCISGNSFSPTFILCWSDTLMQMTSKGHTVSLSVQSTFQKCLAVHPEKGVFQGEDFDLAIFVGPNTVFTPQNVFDLIESPHSVTTGFTMTEDLKTFDAWMSGKPLEAKDLDGGIPRYLPIEFSGLRMFSMSRDFLGKVLQPFFHSTATQSEAEVVHAAVRSHNVNMFLDTKLRLGSEQLLVI